MSQTYLRPPRLSHRNSNVNDDKIELCFDCASRLRMSKGERSLLLYYAACSSGFRPSVQLIADRTDLNRSQVFRCRKKLEEHGVVKVLEDRVIIDWNRIRLFASLDPAMTGRHVTIAPVSLAKSLAPVKPSDHFFTLAPLEEVCDWFSKIGSTEYSKWRRNYRASKEKPQHYQASEKMRL